MYRSARPAHGFQHRPTNSILRAASKAAAFAWMPAHPKPSSLSLKRERSCWNRKRNRRQVVRTGFAPRFDPTALASHLLDCATRSVPNDIRAEHRTVIAIGVTDRSDRRCDRSQVAGAPPSYLERGEQPTIGNSRRAWRRLRCRRARLFDPVLGARSIADVPRFAMNQCCQVA